MSIDRFEAEGVTLICGDCEDVFPIIGSLDLVLADPPYGIGESSRNHQSRNRPGISSTDYGSSQWDNSPPSLNTMLEIVKCASRSIIWGGNFFALPAESKWLVWDKLNSGDFADCELAWTNLGGAVRKLAHRWNGMIRDSERDVPRVHPTQKPVALMAWCIEQSKIPLEAIVLDPFMGSGTTVERKPTHAGQRWARA